MNYGYIWLKINWKPDFSFITKTHRSVGLGTSVATECVNCIGKFDHKIFIWLVGHMNHSSVKLPVCNSAKRIICNRSNNSVCLSCMDADSSLFVAI